MTELSKEKEDYTSTDPCGALNAMTISERVARVALQYVAVVVWHQPSMFNLNLFMRPNSITS